MEYMKLHHISLCQDMEALSTDKEYTTEELLEIADLQGRINQTWELLSVATDIMNSSNERYMLIWEKELEKAQAIEDETEEAMDSMERKYCEGFLDALTALYKLTYDLSFAIGIRTENRKDGHL